MSKSMKRTVWMAVGAAVLAGTMGIAVAGTAAATSATLLRSPSSTFNSSLGITDDATTPRAGGDRAAKVCDHLDAIEAQVAERLAHIASRQGWLADKRAAAVAAGRDEIVARIDEVSAKLTERAAKVQERIGRLDTWAAEHCGQ